MCLVARRAPIGQPGLVKRTLLVPVLALLFTACAHEAAGDDRSLRTAVVETFALRYDLDPACVRKTFENVPSDYLDELRKMQSNEPLRWSVPPTVNRALSAMLDCPLSTLPPG
jgi:hypothetical protein